MQSHRISRRKSSRTRLTERLEDRIAPATLVGLDNSNQLIVFDSASPSTATTIPVTGLGAGESLIGIDFRPATGALYGLSQDASNGGRLYVISPSTGAATLSAVLTADPLDLSSPYTSLSGANFGVDFNPVPDRLRVMSDSNQNLRINVDTGFVTTDTDVSPLGSALAGVAYLNSFAGASGTALFGVDVANDKLVSVPSPNNGVLADVGVLGVDATGVGGFDIISTRSANGSVVDAGVAALTVGGTTSLYNVNLTTGAVLSIGPVGDGSVTLRGLSAPIGNPTPNAFTIDGSNNLVRFNTATPNVTTTVGAISGLGAGENIIGFDFRPANGQLYVVTKDGSSNGRIYTVNTSTAAATLASTLTSDPLDLTNPFTVLDGTSFGVDFNPLANRLRIVSDSGQSLRINVDNGLVTTDTGLNGAATSATGAAYEKNFAGTTLTTLFDIDAATDQLYVQNPPNGGTLVLIGSLGVDATAINGFDIHTNGDAFASLTVGGFEQLYRINLSTGAATLVGSIGGGTAGSLGLSLAPSGAIQLSANTFVVSETAGSATLNLDRVGGTDGVVSVVVKTSNSGAEAGIDYTAYSQVVTFGPGVTSASITIPILDDLLIDANESFIVTLSDVAGGAALGANSSATVTITDNEPTVPAASLIGLNSSNELLHFSTSASGTITAVVPVLGLGAGETLIGIDFRPATGGLYGITVNGTGAGKVYLINPTTGVAALSATLVADPTDGTAPYTGLSGTNFGVDFNPVPDRLRVVSDTNQNLRINVDTGLVITDGELNPSGSVINGAAYLNSFAGSVSTTLYDLDVANDNLVIQNPPNNGTLSSPLPLGIDATGVGGFDIVSTRSASGVVTNTAYAALTVGGTVSVYYVDLSTGAATAFGAIGDGSVNLRGLTAATGAPAATAFTVEASTGHLLRFNTATPSATTDVGAITGLGAGEAVIGFDFRPADGNLYVVTSDGASAARLYTLNTSTAVATLLGTLSADVADTTSPYTALSGANFGVDFNPAANRLRIVSDSGQNLRVNVDTLLVTTDADLNGGATTASAAAYVNNFAGTTTTTLFDIDAASDKLYIQNPPNNGTLVEVGNLGVDATAINGFDVRPNGDAFATLTVAGVSSLYRIDLTTGAATIVGAVGAGTSDTLGLALAANGTFQLSVGATDVNENAGTKTITINRVGGSDGTATVVVNTANGTAVEGSDYSVGSRVVVFGPGVTSRTLDIAITDDLVSEGNETLTVSLGDPTGGAVLAPASPVTVTILDNEPAVTVSIADVSKAEGQSGTSFMTFTVSLNNVAQSDVTLNFATAAGTATAGDDFLAASGSVTIPAGQTSAQIQITISGDTTAEAAETFLVQLSTLSANATFADDTATGTILNDDALIDAAGKTVSYTDPAGNLVTIKTNLGTFSSDRVVLVPFGSAGGAYLAELDLTNGGFDGANVTITSKRSAAGGDGFVNIGYLDATGVALGNVKITGDIGQIDAGAVKSLTVQSIGKFGTSTQAAGGSLSSSFSGNLGRLTVGTDVTGAALTVTGNIGPVKIGGDLIGIDANAPGRISATGDIGPVTIGGDIVGAAASYTGSIEAGGKLASLRVNGSIQGGGGTASGSVIAKTSGAIQVKGGLDFASIFLAGNFPATTSQLALALKSLSVTGSVTGSNILVGYDRTGAALTADVAVGAVSVIGDWTASNLVAGIESPDSIFGNDGDSLIGNGGNPTIAKIASISVRGQVSGTYDIDVDGFGFVAQQIGSFKVGTTKFPLTSGADDFAVGGTGDVRVREYIA